MDFSREREREIELTSLIEIQNLICNITFFLLSFNFFFPPLNLNRYSFECQWCNRFEKTSLLVQRRRVFPFFQDEGKLIYNNAKSRDQFTEYRRIVVIYKLYF